MFKNKIKYFPISDNGPRPIKIINITDLPDEADGFLVDRGILFVNESLDIKKKMAVIQEAIKISDC